MLSSFMKQVNLVELEAKHIELLRSWRNNAATSQFLSAPAVNISSTNQEKWFKRISLDSSEHHYIIAVQGSLVGHASIGIRELDGVKFGQPSLLIGSLDWQKSPVPVMALVKLMQCAFVDLELNLLRSPVHKLNIDAIDLYRAAGFRIIDSEEENFFLTNASKDEFEKSLLQSDLL